jgi:hypothetical protein
LSLHAHVDRLPHACHVLIMDRGDGTGVIAARERRTPLPIAAELALFGACLMAVGVLGPWLVGSYVASRGIEMGGGDGALVLLIACVSALALFNPLRVRLALTGLFLGALGAVAFCVCLVHLKELSKDGVPTGWGLYLAISGAAVLGLAGLRIAAARNRDR